MVHTGLFSEYSQGGIGDTDLSEIPFGH